MRLFEFFQPAWQSEDKDKSLKSIEKITDLRVLSKVAQKAPHRETRFEAVFKIRQEMVWVDSKKYTEGLLVDLAKNAEDPHVRLRAARALKVYHADVTSSINVKKLFSDIAENATDPEVRAAAMKEL